MREIKFRAYDTKKKEMREPGNPYISQFLACDIADKITKIRLPDEDKKHSYVFMQYTGLKDKNGKEIYEGDIIQYLKTAEGGAKTALVERCEETLSCYTTYGSLCNIYFEQHNDERKKKNNYTINDKQYIEVVGNKRETPDLLIPNL